MQMVSELPALSRIAYRILTPLLTGSGLFGAVILLFLNPLRELDAPEWMKELPSRMGLAAFMLGYMCWLSWRVSEVPCWSGIEGRTLHLKTLWSRRVQRRPLSDIQEIQVLRHGRGYAVYRIAFQDGLHVHLEGRFGPGCGLLFARDLTQPSSDPS